MEKNKLIIALFALFLLALTDGVANAADKYPAKRYAAVNDFAHVIGPDHAQRMEVLAQEVLQKTGTAVVVATVTTIGPGEEVSLYVNGLYSAWGIGKKGEDKGVLIFLAVQDRKIRIETGYGVEGILPDGLVGEILDKYVVPQLKTGDYGLALYNAMYACCAYLAKDAGVQLSGYPSPARAKAGREKKGVNIFSLIIFLIIAALLIGTKTGRKMLPWILLLLLSGGGRSSGGGFSGGFGGFGGGSSGGGGAGRSF